MANQWQKHCFLPGDSELIREVFATCLHVQIVVLGAVGKVEEHDSWRLKGQDNANLWPHFEMPVLMSQAKITAVLGLCIHSRHC